MQFITFSANFRGFLPKICLLKLEFLCGESSAAVPATVKITPRPGFLNCHSCTASAFAFYCKGAIFDKPIINY